MEKKTDQRKKKNDQTIKRKERKNYLNRMF